ncbi:MAG: hypothetical protein US96_C0012G0017 [Candidatus Woesebacteria bacterium GW2011_GWB1_38_5b]|uniref:Nudix hydrolase domain-containing protein n=1 Tax=Candidatus Woesebacteria bacterium GW2011_GWB1_38_5b TaxID=1618569 RepID=A0A0G0K6R5_9BACT|nr:MAG: hypothetical protein US96_C0012G0017 [Candidatus Woesebacteria bacterium GW2011_GWB1_38_5b]
MDIQKQLNKIQNTITHKGQQYDLTWIRTDSLEKYSPITQVYGVCFDDKGQILICREGNEASWIIPGGHPEAGETIEQTLQRELLEEVDIKVKDIKILGVQKVEVPSNPEATHFQVRCICKIDELLPQTPDPASGKVWERKLVPVEQINDYVKWGKTGEAIFSDAINLWKK